MINALILSIQAITKFNNFDNSVDLKSTICIDGNNKRSIFNNSKFNEEYSKNNSALRNYFLISGVFSGLFSFTEAMICMCYLVYLRFCTRWNLKNMTIDNSKATYLLHYFKFIWTFIIIYFAFTGMVIYLFIEFIKISNILQNLNFYIKQSECIYVFPNQVNNFEQNLFFDSFCIGFIFFQVSYLSLAIHFKINYISYKILEMEDEIESLNIEILLLNDEIISSNATNDSNLYNLRSIYKTRLKQKEEELSVFKIKNEEEITAERNKRRASEMIIIQQLKKEKKIKKESMRIMNKKRTITELEMENK